VVARALTYGKEHVVTVRRLVLAIGAVILIVGVIGLLVPVSVSDQNGGNIGCGNALISDTNSAESANKKSVANIPILNEVVPHTDYVAECQSALSSRRSWTIPVAVIGAIAVIAAFFVRGGRSAEAL
jgi:heme/copper-type cytochrome/quinol oxidase subunit 1